jgi:ribokinase
MKTPTRQGILVFGSLNMDLVARMSRMPAPGETLLGDSFFVNPGGKGANQAVACALQGAQVRMFGRVGDDVFSDQLRSALDSHAIDHGCVKATPGQSTGIAMIMVDGSAQNSIIVIPGANALVSVDDAEMLQAHVRGAAMLLLQLEVPLPSVVRAAALARAAGCKVLLNPAPARALPPELWESVDILVVNESEASMLAGVQSVTLDNARETADLLRSRGPGDVLLTLAEQGVVWSSATEARHFEARPVTAVDTTAAGDTFIGVLAATWVEGMGPVQAIAHAIRAAAICVTRPGAQASMPTRDEVHAYMSPRSLE